MSFRRLRRRSRVSGSYSFGESRRIDWYGKRRRWRA
jgi:hypothetical protein